MSKVGQILSGNLYRFFKEKIFSGFDQYMHIQQLKKKFPGAVLNNEIKLVGIENIYLAKGVKIDKSCYLNAGGISYCGRDGKIVLDEHCIMGYNSMIFAGGGEVTVGLQTRIGIGCIISAMSEDPFVDPNVTPDKHQHIYETVTIGKNCMIAGGAIILGGTELGDNCIVGSGAVVKGKYPAQTTLIGNPARAIPRLPFTPNASA